MPAARGVALTFVDRRPVPYLQLEPTLVAEVEVDLATGTAGRQRHLARHMRARADLLPVHVDSLHTTHPPP